MKYQLTRGCALVLTGPQGCGKTLLAREIAEAHGTYREIDASALGSGPEFESVLYDEPDTLIVDEFPINERTKHRLKAMISNNIARASRKNCRSKEVQTPYFIFCSNDATPLNLDSGDRRFKVVRLS